jgi:tetratricopeptide (TPR) repeat protein
MTVAWGAPIATLLALALLAYARPAHAAPSVATQAFLRGNQAYGKADYPSAIDAYEQVRALGVVHEDLYYNLANAYYRAGRLGPAILNYERALALDPDQDDARFNLKIARETALRRANDKIEGADREPLWMRVAGGFTLSGATWMFLAAYVALFAALSWLRFVRPGLGRAALGTVTLFLAIGMLCSGAILGGRAYLAERVVHGIVLPDTVAIKDGPDPNYRTAFELHAGLRVRLMERDQDWIRIRLANGLEGWLLESDVGRL